MNSPVEESRRLRLIKNNLQVITHSRACDDCGGLQPDGTSMVQLARDTGSHFKALMLLCRVCAKDLGSDLALEIARA